MTETLPVIETNAKLPAERIAKLAGYGFRSQSDGYLYRPTSVQEIADLFELAVRTGRQVVLRGAGRSYGDANIADEAIMIDICRMRRILSWDCDTGEIDCECGVTIEDLWRATLEDGYWPPVVSGTMFPTLGGTLGMNIHGKNNFRVGTLGEQVVDMDVLFPTGELRTLTPNDDLFYAVISGAGLLGVITRVKLKMKRIRSGDLHVLAISCRNWEEQFQSMRQFEEDSDYLVSWIDCFAGGSGAGRGQIHAAWYAYDGGDWSSTLRPEHQDLPDTIMGAFPKSMVWRILKMFGNRTGMRTINWAKQTASSKLGDRKMHRQSLVAFSFLLDYVPNWRNAYLPGGFIQYQTFVPKEHAQEVFATQVAWQQEEKMESFLGVLKRHRPDRFLFSHAVDGYSFAQDLKATEGNWKRLERLCHRMNDLVLEAGGRFYFAKDSTLRPSDLEAYLGDATLARYRKLKAEFDPHGLLTSKLAVRLGL